MPGQTLEDRRRALNELDESLRRTVITPINSCWTPQLSAAAKSVTDVAPDRLALAQTAVQRAFAAYRPLVEVKVPVADRNAAVQAVDDSVAALDRELSSTSVGLIAAKQFKNDSEKVTIDRARDTIDQASVALTTWSGAFHTFDASVSGTPVPPPEGQTRETYTTFVDDNPYDLQIRASVVNDRDWPTNNRPDRVFSSVRAFNQITGRLDVGTTGPARYRVEVTMATTPSQTIAFTCDQSVLAGPALSLQPLAIEGGSASYAVFQSTDTTAEGKPMLVVLIVEQR